MDNKEVTVLGTAYNPKDASKVNRRAKDGSVDVISCLLPVAEYNRIMGGVDRFD